MSAFKQSLNKKDFALAVHLTSDAATATTTPLIFSTRANQRRAQFLVYRQWYFTTLLAAQEALNDSERSQLISASVKLIQSHLKGLTDDTEQLKQLSSLILCSEKSELLHGVNAIIYPERFGVNATTLNLQHLFEASTTAVVSDIWQMLTLNQSLPPKNRLQWIVKQAKALQIYNCPMHSGLPEDYSICETHLCKRTGYPNRQVDVGKHHKDEVWHVEFSPNGQQAVSVCKQGDIVLWKVRTRGGGGKKRSTYSLEFSACASLSDIQQVGGGVTRSSRNVLGDCITQCIAWDEKGSRFVTSDSSCRIVLWRVDGSTLRATNILEDSEVEARSVVIIGDKVLYTAEDEFIYMWELSAVEVSGGGVPKMECEHANQSLHYSAAKPENLVSVSTKGRVSTISLPKKQELAYFVEGKQIISSTMAADAKSILLNVQAQAGQGEKEIHLWNLETHKRGDHVFKGFKQTECILRPSMQGNYVAIGDESGCVIVWHTSQGSSPVCVMGLMSEADGGMVKVEEDHPTDEDVQRVRARASGSTVNQVHFNPVVPGLLIAGCDDGTVRLFAYLDEEEGKVEEEVKIKVAVAVTAVEKRRKKARKSKVIDEEEGESAEIEEEHKLQQSSVQEEQQLEHRDESDYSLIVAEEQQQPLLGTEDKSSEDISSNSCGDIIDGEFNEGNNKRLS